MVQTKTFNWTYGCALNVGAPKTDRVNEKRKEKSRSTPTRISTYTQTHKHNDNMPHRRVVNEKNWKKCMCMIKRNKEMKAVEKKFVKRKRR